MTARDILVDYLKSHGFDGLCHPPTECGCDLSDLIGRSFGAQQDCLAAHRISDDQGDPWYTIAFDHRPTEAEVRKYWEKARTEG
ncbi:hypothetical protein [Leptospirillum ferriphilum]|uniref:hypothetical protein n=1 Tax=Leptospirillum ferriphilum TaxID=178606 RepID=UPI000B1F68DA|nr:hypothetical protein [Leptospirillum ferriphilum]